MPCKSKLVDPAGQKPNTPNTCIGVVQNSDTTGGLLPSRKTQMFCCNMPRLTGPRFTENLNEESDWSLLGHNFWLR